MQNFLPNFKQNLLIYWQLGCGPETGGDRGAKYHWVYVAVRYGRRSYGRL